VSAGDVIRANKSELTDQAREAHLVAHPGGDTLMTIDRRDDGAAVAGLALDVVFPVLHGPYGEDGTVQGLLELANVPYVGAAVPSAREIECAVLGNDEPEASVPGEILPSREFYDYEAKYLDEASKTVIPAELTRNMTDEVRNLAVAAFKAIDCAGMARVDFLLAGDSGTLYLNELNTIPGFTTISMYSKMWEASGVTYAQLLDRLIALAIERHAEKQQLRTSM